MPDQSTAAGGARRPTLKQIQDAARRLRTAEAETQRLRGALDAELLAAMETVDTSVTALAQAGGMSQSECYEAMERALLARGLEHDGKGRAIEEGR